MLQVLEYDIGSSFAGHARVCLGATSEVLYLSQRNLVEVQIPTDDVLYVYQLPCSVHHPPLELMLKYFEAA